MKLEAAPFRVIQHGDGTRSRIRGSREGRASTCIAPSSSLSLRCDADGDLGEGIRGKRRMRLCRGNSLLRHSTPAIKEEEWRLDQGNEARLRYECLFLPHNDDSLLESRQER